MINLNRLCAALLLALVAVPVTAVHAAPGKGKGQGAAAVDSRGKPAAANSNIPANIISARAILADIRDNQSMIVQYGKDLVAAAQLVLNLDEAMLDKLEGDLEAAYDLAKDAFELLPPEGQTEAALKPLIKAELDKVWALYTQDAGQLAALGTAGQAFIDAVSPLEIEKLKLRSDIKALPRVKKVK